MTIAAWSSLAYGSAMSRRAAPAKQRRSSGQRWLPALTLLAALILTAIGLLQLRALWLRLPAPSLKRVNWDAINARRARFTGTAREGLLLAINSDQFTAAWQKRIPLSRALDETRRRLAEFRSTQLGRLHVAALIMLQMERDGVSPEHWWPQVEPYLAGVRGDDCPHLLAPLLATESAACVRMGLGDTTARQVAVFNLANSHGPFLQVFIQNLARLRNARRDAGDATAAARCDLLSAALLREWIVARGPAGLRLTAADLLVRHGEATTAPAALASSVQGWRAAYHEAALQFGPILTPLRVSDAPLLHRTARQLGTGVLWSIAFAAVVCGGVLVAVALAPWGLRATEPGALFGPAALAFGLLTVLGVVLAWQMGVDSDGLQADLRRVSSDELGRPRTVLWLAGIMVIGGATVGGLLGAWCGRRAGLQAAGRAAAAATLALAAALMLSLWATESTRRLFESVKGAAYVAGIEAELPPAVLDALRDQKP